MDGGLVGIFRDPRRVRADGFPDGETRKSMIVSGTEYSDSDSAGVWYRYDKGRSAHLFEGRKLELTVWERRST